jgi:hypothetical protein
MSILLLRDPPSADQDVPPSARRIGGPQQRAAVLDGRDLEVSQHPPIARQVLKLGNQSLPDYEQRIPDEERAQRSEREGGAQVAAAVVVRLVRDHHTQPAAVRPQRGGHDDEGDAREAGSEGDRGPIAGAQAHATHAFDDGQLVAMAAESPAPNHQGREAEERGSRETGDAHAERRGNR